MMKDNYKDCLEYIAKYWGKIEHHVPNDDGTTGDFGLPQPYLSPNEDRFRNQFYWDSYFMMLGILGSKQQQLISSMVTNFIYLYKRFGLMPNFSHVSGINRSQPPFFSDMVLLNFQITNSKSQLQQEMEYAKKEYETVWTGKNLGTEGVFMGNYHHTAQGYGLSRYGDRDAGYALLSELESGWDLTLRFGNACNEFLPVDLNSLLYRYEQNFIATAKMLGNKDDKAYFTEKAKKRQEEMNKLMWNEEKGFYFDFRYSDKTQSEFYSLAGFVPLWAGLATKEQATKMVKQLNKFETAYGLTITAKESLPEDVDILDIPIHVRKSVSALLAPKQWDYPHSWPPLEYLTIIGLLRYGFKEKASKLMEKYLATHAAFFRKHGRFAEKIDATTGDIPQDYHYKNQDGFGWTNAVFVVFVNLLDNPDMLSTYVPNYEHN